MRTPDQIVKIKCPHCGWVRSVNARVIEDESMADAVRGTLSEAMRGAVDRIQAALASSDQEPLSDWIDMPECPECGNVYQYNVRTRERRK